MSNAGRSSREPKKTGLEIADMVFRARMDGKLIPRCIVPFLSEQEFDFRKENERLYREFLETMNEEEARQAAEDLSPDAVEGEDELGFHKTYIIDWTPVFPGCGLWDYLTYDDARKAGIAVDKIDSLSKKNLSGKIFSLLKDSYGKDRQTTVLRIGLKDDLIPSCACSALILNHFWKDIGRELGAEAFFVFPKYRAFSFAVDAESEQKARSAVMEASSPLHSQEPFSDRAFFFNGEHIVSV